MPQATKINIYLGTGREGNERERLISKAAKEKGATILPLIIHPCDYATSPLSIFQAVNDPNEALSELPKPEQERHYIKLVKRITELLRE